MHRIALRCLALSAVALGACGGDGPTTTDRLTPQQVAGAYAVCQLRFQPENSSFREADVLLTVMDTSPPSGRPAPSLALSGVAPQFDLVYVRVSDAFLRQRGGSVSFGPTHVTLRLWQGEPDAVSGESLLPNLLTLSFDAEGRRLIGNTALYTVRRADYARAAGIPEVGLQERINGRMQVMLRAGSCP